MQKRFSIFVTIVNVLVCSLISISLLAETDNVKAQTPTAFLGPIYYGFPTVVTIFDHSFPVLDTGTGDGNDCTQHNDGTSCVVSPPFGLGYDEHNGIDYDLNYRPVLAATNGTVTEAGWSHPANHQQGLGMRIKINHSNGFTTEYGHLNVIVATYGQVISDPANRENIIGISGNTGNSEGAHLHFGLMNPDGVYVNPYGWQGLPVLDPWEHHPQGLGAPSYDVWEQYPAIQLLNGLDELQYPTGPIVYEPPVNDYGSLRFSVVYNCWHGKKYRSKLGRYTQSQGFNQGDGVA